MPKFGRRDQNEAEIVAALEAAGCEVFRLTDHAAAGLPDLLVFRLETRYAVGGHVDVETVRLLEVKTATGKERPEQTAFRLRWPSSVHVVRSPIEALSVMGIQAALIRRESRHIAQAGSR